MFSQSIDTDSSESPSSKASGTQTPDQWDDRWPGQQQLHSGSAYVQNPHMLSVQPHLQQAVPIAFFPVVAPNPVANQDELAGRLQRTEERLAELETFLSSAQIPSVELEKHLCDKQSLVSEPADALDRDNDHCSSQVQVEYASRTPRSQDARDQQENMAEYAQPCDLHGNLNCGPTVENLCYHSPQHEMGPTVSVQEGAHTGTDNGQIDGNQQFLEPSLDQHVQESPLQERDGNQSKRIDETMPARSEVRKRRKGTNPCELTSSAQQQVSSKTNGKRSRKAANVNMGYSTKAAASNDDDDAALEEFATHHKAPPRNYWFLLFMPAVCIAIVYRWLQAVSQTTTVGQDPDVISQAQTNGTSRISATKGKSARRKRNANDSTWSLSRTGQDRQVGDGSALDAGIVLNATAFDAKPLVSNITFDAEPEHQSPVAVTSIFGDLGDGKHKWWSAVQAPNGFIYGIPCHANAVLRIDPTSDSFITFGSLSNQPFKWVVGVIALNGIIYGIPASAKAVLRIDPISETVTMFGRLSDKASKWTSGLLAPNGRIYCVPNSANGVLKLDPTTDTLTTIGDFGNSRFKWTSGVLARNGAIYGIPSHARAVLKIDPTSDKAITFGTLPATSNKWSSGILAHSGAIYAIPSSSNQVLKVDTVSDTPILLGDLGGEALKWMSGVLADNGAIYGIPSSANSVLRIDTTSDTITTFGSIQGKGDMWRFTEIGANGQLYAIPFHSSVVLNINPALDIISHCGSFKGQANKWRVGITAKNGFIYGIPLSAGAILKIDTSAGSECGNAANARTRRSGQF